jgi:chemotaxis protein methyltransferase CheR
MRRTARKSSNRLPPNMLLLEDIYQRWGYELRELESPALAKRLKQFAKDTGYTELSKLREAVLEDKLACERLVDALVPQPRLSLFDASFYLDKLKKCVVPRLKTYPSLKIWIAARPVPEHLCSLAVLLCEEGLIERTKIYVTDLGTTVLQRAKLGTISVNSSLPVQKNYEKAGGQKTLSRYFKRRGRRWTIIDDLRGQFQFFEHNLICDESPNEFQLIICRNFLKHVGKDIRLRVYDLFYRSLPSFGVLALGNKDFSLDCEREIQFKPLDETAQLYRKVG